MATDQTASSPISVVSVLEDVLQQHATRLSEVDLASRKPDLASCRRYEVAAWLRKMVGVVGNKELPAHPSEEEFRLGLRSGIILCNVLNRIQPGAVPKVVEAPPDSDSIPDGAALHAFQYFENVRNFLVAIEEQGIPTFEASDLEQGGKSSRIVNCVLALKSYGEWKQNGSVGTWKYSGNSRSQNCVAWKPFMRKSAEPFMNSFSQSSSLGSGDQSFSDDLSEAGATTSLNVLVRSILSNKKQEEIPNIVEAMLSKVMEEFEHRLAGQNVQMKTTTKDMSESSSLLPISRTSSVDTKMEDVASTPTKTMEEESPTQTKITQEEASSEIKMTNEESTPKMIEFFNGKDSHDKESRIQLSKQQMLVKRQERDIQDLKHILHTTKSGMQLLQTKYEEEFNYLGKHLHNLAYAASGYQRVLAENRKLYNQVQDLKGNIRVYCRVRPFLNGQPSHFSTVEHIEEGDITILTPPKLAKEGRKSFSFNKVFGPTSTQAEVFSDTQPLIRSVLDGYNVCIFAYGQTGSGKTFTMSGPKELTEEGLGVNYRALNDLFLLSNQRKDAICYNISVQMLEIYNEQVRDLLATDGINRRLEIRNSSQNGINVPDATLLPVSSTPDVINLMKLGQKNRAVSATAMNDRSSRSHCCLTVHVQGEDLTSGNVLRGSMHLVDLAGSERVDKSKVTGDSLKEAQHINKSLAALGDVIASLAQKSSHVPYRNSKLTQLLQDSLGGQAKTLMFVHISPEPDAIGETISTLKFAERVATVELGAARVNKDGSEVKELKEQIASLKAALARKDGESEHSSRPTTPETFRMKSAPPQHGWQSVEGKNKTSSIPRRRSLDPNDLLMNSPLWSAVASPAQNGKEDDKESVSGDWVDKVMVNRHDSASREENHAGQWEVYGKQFSETFFESSNIFPGQPYNKSSSNRKDSQELDARSHRSEVASTDDSDEVDAATSDSSEPDLLWQSNLPRMSSLPNISGNKPKKTNPRPTKITETRSLIPSLIPSLARKPNGVSQTANKAGRQGVLVDAKRKAGHAK